MQKGFVPAGNCSVGMAQALLCAGSGTACSCASSVPPSMHLLCTSSQHSKYTSISNLGIRPDRERLFLESQKIVQVPYFSRAAPAGRRLRLVAFAQLQTAGTAVEEVTAASTVANDGFPAGAGTQLDSALAVEGQNGSKAFNSSAPLVVDDLSPATVVPPSSSAESVPIGPDVGLPESTANQLPEPADILSIQSAVEAVANDDSSGVKSIGESGPRTLEAAQEANGNIEPFRALDGTGADTLPSPLSTATDTVSRTTKAAANMLEDTKASFTKTLTAAQDTVTNTVTNIEDAVRDSVGSAGNAVRNVYDSINGSIKNGINSVTGFYDHTVEDIQTKVDRTVSTAEGGVVDFTSPFRMGTPINNTLNDIVVVVKSATGSALMVSGKLVEDIYGSTKALLPTDAQSALSVVEQKIHDVSEPVGYALQQAYDGIASAEKAVGVDPENPIIPVLLVIGGTIYLGVSYWQATYGGYSGDLIPSVALDLVKKEGNVVLVDVRPQEIREKEGIPDLRRGARSRSAVVEVVEVEGSLKSKLKNAKEIDNILTAAIIRNLKNVKPSTKVIVMDADGSRSKEVARALRRFGLKRGYRVEGGFRAWTAAGLRIKIEGLDTPISILKEDTADIVEEVQPTAVGVVSVALGIVAAIYALIEWEKALQLLGVIGIGQVVYSRVGAYESMEDVKADIQLLQRPFMLVVEGILWISGQVKPDKLQLATSPSTSAVQDRVFQAAAKHGPLASEVNEAENIVTDESGATDVSSADFSPPAETK